MAKGVNRVFIIGHLGKDPEVRYTSQGEAMANFAVATTETFNDKQGQRQDRTEWHRIKVFGKTAELCGEFLNKGRQVYLEGKIQTRKWQDKNGQDRYTTEILAQTVQFLGGVADVSANPATPGHEAAARPQGSQFRPRTPHRDQPARSAEQGPQAYQSHGAREPGADEEEHGGFGRPDQDDELPF